VLISCQWLTSLLGPGPTNDPTPAAIAEALTDLGLEVESETPVGQERARVLVGDVRAQGRHPNADRLAVVELFDGRETRRVVCGAGNLPASGGKVAFAPTGTVLPGGFEIIGREIRGVPSDGMICSEAELDLGPDGSGIVVLPTSWTPGASLADLLPGAQDTILELSITPNRPDALGHVGVARDLGVRLQRPLELPPLREPDYPQDPSLVTIEAADRCARYLGFAFEGVAVEDSPLWLRLRLHRLGLRPINNVVDITNFALLEWGQPLHGFDRARLGEGRIVVRLAADSEPIRTLDEQDLELTMDDLAICDASRPQALAGIIGGVSSAVEAGTTRVLLEAAHFAPKGIRRTARRHRLVTEASYRFERGVDHGRGLGLAAWRACNLLEDLASARGVAQHAATGDRPRRAAMDLRAQRMRLVLGMAVPTREVERILTGLEVDFERKDGAKCWSCTAPSHRPDLAREEDLIEEIVRHHGLEHLPAVAAGGAAVGTDLPVTDPRTDLQTRLTEALRDVGLHEVISFAFADPERIALFADETDSDRVVRVSNPMREDAGVLRFHMLPGLLDALALNLARHGQVVRIFECGRIYAWSSAGPTSSTEDGPTAAVDAQLPREIPRAALLLHAGRGPRAASCAPDARDLAGILLHVLSRLGLRAEILPSGAEEASYLHPGIQARLSVLGTDGAKEIGVFGAVHPDVLTRWGIVSGFPALYGELHVDRLPDLGVPRHTPVPRFPATSRDVSLDVPVEVAASIVVDALREAAAAVEQDRAPTEDEPPGLARGDDGSAPVEVLEDYRGEGIAPSRKALLVRLHYRASSRSITDAEVMPIHEAIVARACEALAGAAPGIRRR
jgi:phenylalanyl-tRNA synthetase beta chain